MFGKDCIIEREFYNGGIQMECEHKFVHLETIRKDYYDSGCTHFLRIDRFYCEKCLEEKEVKKESWCRNTPEWY